MKKIKLSRASHDNLDRLLTLQADFQKDKKDYAQLNEVMIRTGEECEGTKLKFFEPAFENLLKLEYGSLEATYNDLLQAQGTDTSDPKKIAAIHYELQNLSILS